MFTFVKFLKMKIILFIFEKQYNFSVLYILTATYGNFWCCSSEIIFSFLIW